MYNKNSNKNKKNNNNNRISHHNGNWHNKHKVDATIRNTPRNASAHSPCCLNCAYFDFLFCFILLSDIGYTCSQCSVRMLRGWKGFSRGYTMLLGFARCSWACCCHAAKFWNFSLPLLRCCCCIFF